MSRQKGTIDQIQGLQSSLDGKQDDLVSGTNIKTINGESIIGSGNIVTSGAQNLFIQENEPTISPGTSALWIQKLSDGNITFNLCEN